MRRDRKGQRMRGLVSVKPAAGLCTAQAVNDKNRATTSPQRAGRQSGKLNHRRDSMILDGGLRSSTPETQSFMAFASQSRFRNPTDHVCLMEKFASSARQAASTRSSGQLRPAGRMRRIRRVEKPVGISTVRSPPENSTPQAGKPIMRSRQRSFIPPDRSHDQSA